MPSPWPAPASLSNDQGHSIHIKVSQQEFLESSLIPVQTLQPNLLNKDHWIWPPTNPMEPLPLVDIVSGCWVGSWPQLRNGVHPHVHTQPRTFAQRQPSVAGQEWTLD